MESRWYWLRPQCWLGGGTVRFQSSTILDPEPFLCIIVYLPILSHYITEKLADRSRSTYNPYSVFSLMILYLTCDTVGSFTERAFEHVHVIL